MLNQLKRLSVPAALGLVVAAGLVATWPQALKAQTSVPTCGNGWGRECAEHTQCALYDPQTGLCSIWNTWYYNWTLG